MFMQTGSGVKAGARRAEALETRRLVLGLHQPHARPRGRKRAGEPEASSHACTALQKPGGDLVLSANKHSDRRMLKAEVESKP